MKRKMPANVIAGSIVLVALATLTTVSALLVDESAPTHFDQDVVALREQLAAAKDPTIAASLREKLEIAETSQRDEREANAVPVDARELKAKQDALATAIAGHGSPPAIEKDGQPAGSGFIVEGLQPPLPAATFRGVEGNMWFTDPANGARVTIWAGASGQDREQGILVVASDGPRVEGIYPAPGKHGSLRIVGADGIVLRLIARDGTELAFDVASRTYR